MKTLTKKIGGAVGVLALAAAAFAAVVQVPPGTYHDPASGMTVLSFGNTIGVTNPPDPTVWMTWNPGLDIYQGPGGERFIFDDGPYAPPRIGVYAYTDGLGVRYNGELHQ